jgi:hypothetical protein
MRRLPFLLIIFISSCKSPSEVEKIQQTLVGKWLIIAPDPVLKNSSQRQVYKHIQDSLVDLRALKMIMFSDDGGFQQMDSLEMKGRWNVSTEKVIHIERGGAGFENYSVKFTDYKEGRLQLTGFIQAEGESIKLIWVLKKVTGSAASELFSPKNNEWRRRPVQPETTVQIKKRLADMLNYYSSYDNLVAKESTFFIPSRVIIPFRFYQHAMGMKDLSTESSFSKLFFNNEQAEQAYGYLSEAVTLLKSDFPSISGSYLKEYAAFMEKMADAVVKTD